MTAFLLSLFVHISSAQPVQVTLSLGTTHLAVGSTTTLQVSAQITPALRSATDRVFSWYVDLLNSSPGVAQFDLAQLAKPMADRDPRTSSSGRTDGINCRGIYDTFLNLPGAGKEQPVVLFTVPIRAVATGRVVFSIQAGTTVPNLSADFIVAPAGGGEPLIGGDYTTATIELIVGGASECVPNLQVSSATLPGGQIEITLAFTPCVARQHTVEYRDGFEPGTAWSSLPAGPHNSGSVRDLPSGARRFYRLRTE
jgi:hypothetical protein